MQQRIPFLSIMLFLLASVITQAQDISTIKKRVVDDLLAPSVNTEEIAQLVKTINPDGTWPGIDYKDVSRTGFQHKQHLDNMLALARAYKKRGTTTFAAPPVKAAFSSALDFWLAHDFRCDNWWWNEMGTPNLMINTLLVMDDALTEKQKKEGLLIAHRANMETFGARPGGDLMPIAGMFAKQGLFLGNADTLRKALKAMAADIHTSTGRGLKPDKSFHHRTDNVISTLTYGSNYASSFAYWAAKIRGAGFSFPDSALLLVTDYFLDGICQSLVYATYPDPGAMNRDISRKNALEAEDISLPQNLLKASNYRSKELEAIIAIREGKIKPVITRDRYFWHSHYYTHQRPGYYASVRMHSARANNMEEPHNEEGIKNHYYGDGSLFISRTGHEYFNIFPVWDWRKIPGATIVQKNDFPHWKQLAKKGLTDFAGGVSDGRFGVAAFDFASVHDPLKAHKSWFFFDNEIVCLGAGIQVDTAVSVATTLNQCLLNGPVTVKDNSNSTTLSAGNHTLANTSWVYHDSVAYIFPQPTTVNISNGEATGNWRQINHQAWATEETVRKNVFTLWLDHGVQPKNAGYSWIVVPGIDAASAEKYSQQSPVTILVNTPDLQAVKHAALERTQVVFYKAGVIKIYDDVLLEAANPCIVMVKTKGKIIEQIAVADPTQKLASLQLKLVNYKTRAAGKRWAATWDKSTNTSTIGIVLPSAGYAGQTSVMHFTGILSK